MKKLCFLLLAIGHLQIICAQSVAINNTNTGPASSAILDVSSTQKGLLIPRMSTTERTGIATPNNGLLVFDNDTNSFWFYGNSAWTQISTSNSGWNLSGNTATSAGSFIGTTDNLPLRFKTNNQWSGEINPLTTNIFLGPLSGNASVTGVANTAIGGSSLGNNTSGQFNVSFGINTMANNLSGSYNAAIGERVLQFNTGSYNTGLGAEALRNNSNGTNNVAVGSFALYNNTQGFFNTAVGYNSLLNTAVGTTLTCLGYNADVNGEFYSNSTAIGASARVDASNKVRVGSTTVSSIGGQVGWSTFSDGRYKQQVKEDVPGLAFIRMLRPVTYTVDLAGLDQYFKTSLHQQPSIKRESGFIAQEVEAAAQKNGFSFSGVDTPKNPDGLYALRYADFVVPLVKALQEQQAIIEAQQTKMNAMEKRLEKLEATLLPGSK
ncbi:MAG: hypothetical protein JWQ27_2381 [Ferruginibacter sp.]|nr:hypothetical protein [Ferruginibacter sp.]